jgi:hypothetical protein
MAGLYNPDGVEPAEAEADAALDTASAINGVRFFLFPGNGIFRTFHTAEGAAGAGVCIYLVGKEILAHAGAAFFIENMGLVFMLEIPDRAQDRVAGRAAEAAERGGGHETGKF